MRKLFFVLIIFLAMSSNSYSYEVHNMKCPMDDKFSYWQFRDYKIRGDQFLKSDTGKKGSYKSVCKKGVWLKDSTSYKKNIFGKFVDINKKKIIGRRCVTDNSDLNVIFGNGKRWPLGRESYINHIIYSPNANIKPLSNIIQCYPHVP
ncbi:hypothetical protein N9I63_01425 [Hyphomicrobiales bacterium]|nr:hypothetical protein [Hyphomicrobiales bacterium]